VRREGAKREKRGRGGKGGKGVMETISSNDHLRRTWVTLHFATFGKTSETTISGSPKPQNFQNPRITSTSPDSS
jgi:hypothetical protein